MAKSQKDFLKDLQLSAKSQAEQRFDVIADVKDVLTVDVQEEKAKLDTYKEIEEVAVTSEVLEIFEHSSSEIEKIKSEDITPLKAEYTNCAELAKSNADDLEKEEERSKGVYSIDRQIREARKEVHSSKEAWRKAQKDAKIQGRDKSNIFGRMLGRFTGIDMGQDAYRQAKKSVKQAHKAYRSSKRSLARVKQQMAERKERLEEKRAKATYYKEKMIDIEQKIKAAKGKISHVNQKLLVHT